MPVVKKITYYFLYFLIILLLASVCVGIIFYASGYRLNTKAMEIQKTGLLIIDCKEDNIEIYIDGTEEEVKKNILPHIISSPYSLVMLPGEYDLEIKKEGKIPYKDHIVIEPELITKIKDLILFPEEINKETVLEEEIFNFAISPDNKKIIYTDNFNDVRIHNIEDRSDEKEKKDEIVLDNILFSNKTVSSYIWSPNNSKVIIKISDPESIFNYLLDLNNLENSYFLHEKFSYVPFFEETFFSEKNPHELFGIADGNFYSINTATLNIKKIDEDIDSLKKEGSYVYYYKIKRGEIIQFDTNIYKKTVIKEDFERMEDFQINSLSNNREFYIKNGGKIYLVKNKGGCDPLDENVDQAFFDKENNNFYYTKGFELWFYDKGEKTLITRFSKQINDLKKYYNDNYLIYTYYDGIGIIKHNGKNDTEVESGVRIEFIKTIDKNKIIIVEQKEHLKSFNILEL